MKMRMKVEQFFKNELSGWKSWEIIWFSTTCIVIMGISVYSKDSLMGIVSAITGIANVVCTGKGKLSAFIFGIINSLLYGIISYKACLYGETMLNFLYYFPMQFIGFYVWNKHIDKNTGEVKKNSMNKKGRFSLVLLIVIFTFLYGLFLKNLGDEMPFVDSFTTVSSVVALVISVKMFLEQWWIWLFVDALSVYMWWNDFKYGNGNMATLLMWIIFLCNAIIMLIKWKKEV